MIKFAKKEICAELKVANLKGIVGAKNAAGDQEETSKLLSNFRALDDRVGMLKEVRQDFSYDLLENESFEEDSEQSNDEIQEEEEIAHSNDVEATDMLKLFSCSDCEEVGNSELRCGQSSEFVPKSVDQSETNYLGLMTKFGIWCEKIIESRLLIEAKKYTRGVEKEKLIIVLGVNSCK